MLFRSDPLQFAWRGNLSLPRTNGHLGGRLDLDQGDPTLIFMDSTTDPLLEHRILEKLPIDLEIVGDPLERLVVGDDQG